jgi:hypothetical protein
MYSAMHIAVALVPSCCRDFAAEAAMTMQWPGTVHLICEWHFMKNLKENLLGALGNATWEVRAIL